MTQRKKKVLRNKLVDSEEKRADLPSGDIPNSIADEPDARAVSGSYFQDSAEPFWMQDCRIAQKKIAQQISAIRASKRGGRPGGEP